MASYDSKSVFDYIFGLTVPGVKLELSRVEAFMEKLGHPHRAYPVIHIAGTNGKGSTAAMLAAILNAYGKKTGLFTSPHLIRPNERIRIGDMLVPDQFIIQHVEAWKDDIEENGITFFEVLTALGMEYFKQESVDYAVFETGLGGRLDATNVVDPVFSLITSISMDHENILGDDLATIAGEKAGIIKHRKPILLGKNSEIVKQVVEGKSRGTAAPFTYVPDKVIIQNAHRGNLSQQITATIGDQLIEVSLPLQGKHQVENFANVLAALASLGFDLDGGIIQKGLNEMVWPGRLQTLQQDPHVLYDVAHNPEGMARLLETFQHLEKTDCIIIAGFNARKNIRHMLEMLKAWSGPVIYSTFEGHSAIDYNDLIQMGIHPDNITRNLRDAYNSALSLRSSMNQSICFVGSHYLAESLFPMFEGAE